MTTTNGFRALALLTAVLGATPLGCTHTCTSPGSGVSPASPGSGVSPASPGAAETLAAPGASAPRYGKPSEPTRVVRFDFVVTATGGGKPDTASTHTLMLEEGLGHSGQIRIGSNVPLQTNAPPPPPPAGGAATPPKPGGGLPAMAPRMDVGLMIKCEFTSSGEELLLKTSVEMSAADEPPAIRKVVTNGDALIPLGKSTLVASTEDGQTHRRYEVTVTATRLR